MKKYKEMRKEKRQYNNKFNNNRICCRLDKNTMKILENLSINMNKSKHLIVKDIVTRYLEKIGG